MIDRPWEEDVLLLQEKINGGFPPVMDDLDYIYKLVQERKPQRIVEMGAGYSSVVFLHALGNVKERGQFLSIESSDYFVHIVRPSLNKVQKTYTEEGINIEAQIVLSTPRSVTPVLTEYSFIPYPFADLLYVDGPPLCGLAKTDITPLHFIPECRTILVDGRNTQAAFLHAVLQEYYELTVDNENFRALFTLRKKMEKLPNFSYPEYLS